MLPHADRLFRLAMWFERNRADAEDVVQETMMQALRSFHRFQPGTNCRAWLTTILQHIVSNRRRAKGRSIVVSDPDDRIAQTVPFVPPVPQDLTDELVLSSLQRLPTAFQEVILLCDVEDLLVQGSRRSVSDSDRNRDVASSPRPRATALGARCCRRRLHRASTERRSGGHFGRENRGVMNCRDVREVADSFLCEELLTETNHEILRHLDTCPSCRTETDARRRLRGAVRTAFNRAPELQPAGEFADRLRDQLRQASVHRHRSWTFPGRWLALAAGLVLAAGVTAAILLDRSPAPAEALAQDAIGDHRNCALKYRLVRTPVPLEEAAQRFDSAYRLLLSAPPDDISTPDGPFAWSSGTPASMGHIGSDTSSCSIAVASCRCS